jgi:hypothetical protein
VPWGKRSRCEEDQFDCGCDCRFFAQLSGESGDGWGACLNRRSPRAGLLTFELQGCREFERAPRKKLRNRQPRTAAIRSTR